MHILHSLGDGENGTVPNRLQIPTNFTCPAHPIDVRQDKNGKTCELINYVCQQWIEIHQDDTCKHSPIL